ncbi:hypothetical protein DBR06_SOUSAS49110001 [Sousa chinensis]|nr:hypothetical protein DBR06_SOUSAS49110001 [Sousa chinensis]
MGNRLAPLLPWGTPAPVSRGDFSKALTSRAKPQESCEQGSRRGTERGRVPGSSLMSRLWTV